MKSHFGGRPPPSFLPLPLFGREEVEREREKEGSTSISSLFPFLPNLISHEEGGKKKEREEEREKRLQ